ncbi:MAG TPA: hypothetical protein VGD78_04285 [Chthoniobacterales bacterium]
MKTWTLCLVLFATVLGGLINAKADDDRDYWRYRHERRYNRYGDREGWRYRQYRHDRWREREARRNYWRHRRHHYRRSNEVVIQWP